MICSAAFESIAVVDETMVGKGMALVRVSDYPFTAGYGPLLVLLGDYGTDMAGALADRRLYIEKYRL